MTEGVAERVDGGLHLDDFVQGQNEVAFLRDMNFSTRSRCLVPFLIVIDELLVH